MTFQKGKKSVFSFCRKNDNDHCGSFFQNAADSFMPPGSAQHRHCTYRKHFMEASTREDAAWKIFNRDTEAGRLLSRLYGVKPSVTQHEPSKRRRRRTHNPEDEGAAVAPTTRSWKTTFTVHSRDKVAEEEKDRVKKENAAKRMSLVVPKVGRSSDGDKKKKVDKIPRRKKEIVCKNAIEDALEKKRMYKPPHSKDVSSDKEKARLQKLMTGESQSPSPPKLRIASSSSKHGSEKSVHPPVEEEETTLFDQLLSEIYERKQHQQAMEEMGAGADTRSSTAIEIKQRVDQLRKLDPQRASEVVRIFTKS